MKKLQNLLPIAVLAVALALSANKAAAQPGMGGMPDPKQIAQMQVDALRDIMVVTNDDDWKAIAPRLMKVIEIKSAISMAEAGRMMARMGGGRMGGMANLFGGQAADPVADALQKALDDHAPAADVKNALAKFRDAKKQKLAELTKAQDDLKQILSTRQEAALAMVGMVE